MHAHKTKDTIKAAIIFFATENPLRESDITFDERRQFIPTYNNGKPAPPNPDGLKFEIKSRSFGNDSTTTKTRTNGMTSDETTFIAPTPFKHIKKEKTTVIIVNIL